jgi:alkane 1-monooxygenase
MPLRDVLRIWSRHLVSLVLPVNALLFLWTGPHLWYEAPLFLIPLGVAYAYDDPQLFERRQPREDLPAWPFDGLVYLLAALQFAVIFGLARMFAHASFFSVDMLLSFVIVGAGSGFSIITAHELIHRRKRWEQQLGRLLLCTVLNEHFYTEHLRGHHVKVGTPEDPATARFGESYQRFYWRTIRGQFASAWRLESRRLGEPGAFGAHMLRNRILQGIAVGWGLALAISWGFGWVALAAFALQAFSASRLLEAVNYFEHWGLERRSHRVTPVDSWDTHAWFTYYGLTGLSRHADHHAEPARPFQQLRVMDEAPVLPGGYVRMVDQVVGRNDEYQRAATDELERLGLGPFRGGGAPDADPRDAQPAAGRRPLRVVAVIAGLLLAVTAGALWESGAGDFASLLGLHTWIAAVFAAALGAHALSARRFAHEGFNWAVAFAVLLSLGALTESLF